MQKIPIPARVLGLALLVTSQMSLAGFSQTLAYVQQPKAVTAPATAQLRIVLLELQEHYKVEIVFEDRLVASRTISSQSVDYSQSVERNLNRILSPMNLKVKKVRKNTFVIKEASTQSPSAPQTSVDKTDARAGEESGPAGSGFTVNPVAPVLAKEEMAPKRLVRGTVTDENNAGLPGVSILIKNTQRGTTTDQNGKYSLTLQDKDATLVFSYVGYEPRELSVLGNQTQIDVVLKASANTLSEVIVTAVGLERSRKSIGYSIQEVKGSELVSARETNIVSALSGKVAGVQVINSGGSPGAAAIIRIRGNSSLFSNNSPLFVIDGVPVDNSNDLTFVSNANSGVTQSNRAIDFNPDDIEKMSVLKGPSATALYGIRASNGAIIISTKRGKVDEPGKLNITYSTALTVDEVNRRVQPTQQKFSQGVNGQYRSPGVGGSGDVWGARLDTLRYSTQPSLFDRKGTIVGQSNPTARADAPVLPYDNVGNFFQKGITYNNHLSVSGATEKSDFYLSAGRLSQTGIVPETDYIRTTFRLTGGVAVTPRLRVSASANYINSTARRTVSGGAPSGVIRGLLSTAPSFDITNGSADPSNDLAAYQLPNGTQRSSGGGVTGFDNPYWSINNNPHSDAVNRLIGFVQADYELTDWLRLTARAGTDFSAEDRRDVFSRGSLGFTPGTVNEIALGRRDINTDIILTATKSLTPDLQLTVLAGHNFFDFNRQQQISSGIGLTIPFFYNLLSASTFNTSKSTTRRRLVAAYADVRLAYKNWLFLDLTGRNEFTSTLPPNSNSFFYPSVNAAFVFSDALKLQNNVFSFGKVRASYALVGNDAPPYSLNTPFGTSFVTSSIFAGGIQFPFNNQAGLSLSNNAGNPLLRPEQTTTYEVGTELRFFNNRIGLDAVYYNSTSRDQIIPITIPASSGFTTSVTNAGVITNRGVEILLDATPIKSKNIRWDMALNFTHNVNMVQELAPGVSSITLLSIGPLASSRLVPGAPYGALYGTKLFTDDKGNVLIDDTRQLNGVANQNYGYPIRDPNQTLLGDPNPKFIAGLRNSLTYKALTLSFLMDVKYKFDLFNGTRAQLAQTGTALETEVRGQPRIFDGVKRTEGTPNDITVNPGRNWYNSTVGINSLYMEDGTWARLRELNLTYTLPIRFIKRFGLQATEVGFTGRNLLLLTRYTGADPDANARGGASNGYGIDFHNTPGTRSYGFSLRLTL